MYIDMAHLVPDMTTIASSLYSTCATNRVCFLLLKVISSVVDQDSYVGFVGVQGRKSPTQQPKKPSKPDVPPPAPNMKIRQRVSSLSTGKKPPPPAGAVRPPKPDLPPPPFQPEGNVKSATRTPLKPTTKHELNSSNPRSRSPSPKVDTILYCLLAVCLFPCLDLSTL